VALHDILVHNKAGMDRALFGLLAGILGSAIIAASWMGFTL
jgi:hypothetical protein